MNNASVTTTYTRILARTLGLSRETMSPLLKGTDFSANDIEFERRMLTSEQQYRIITNALSFSVEPGLGLKVGEQAELSMHGLLGLAAMTSATLYEALVMFAKYHFLRAPFLAMTLHVEEDDLEIVMANADDVCDSVACFMLESYGSMMQSMTEYIIGRPVVEAKVSIPAANEKANQLYQRYFHGQVSQSQDNAFHYRLPMSLANSPCPARDDELHQRAEDGCRNLLDKIDVQNTTRGKVEEIFNVQDGVFLTLEECAHLLHMSERTLIRRLKKEGVTYRQLIEQKQKSLAVHLLSNRNLTVEAVALQLGYEYAPNFRRAFKQWFNVTPSQYRERL